MGKRPTRPAPESGARKGALRCPECGCPCTRCGKSTPGYIPENPRVTIDQVLQVVRNFDGPITAGDVAMVFEKMSSEDASNRLRRLRRANLIQISGRRGREILYQPAIGR